MQWAELIKPCHVSASLSLTVRVMCQVKDAELEFEYLMMAACSLSSCEMRSNQMRDVEIFIVKDSVLVG